MQSADPYIANIESFLDGVDKEVDTLAQFLTQGRKARDMTQAALAAAIGIKRQQHISNFECGQSKPTRNQLDRLCAVLDLDRDEAHALLGQLPLDVEAAWLGGPMLRKAVRDHIDFHMNGLKDGW